MKSAVILQVRWGFKGVKRLETCSGLTQMLRKATLRAALPGKRTEDTSENQSRGEALQILIRDAIMDGYEMSKNLPVCSV